MNATLTIDIFKHYFDIDVVCPVVRGKLFCPRCSEIGGGRCDEVAEVLLDDLFTIDAAVGGNYLRTAQFRLASAAGRAMRERRMICDCAPQVAEPYFADSGSTVSLKKWAGSKRRSLVLHMYLPLPQSASCDVSLSSAPTHNGTIQYIT